MTREEAIEILTHNWTRVDNPNYSESELDEAFFMAIEALTEETIEIKQIEVKGDFHIDDIDENRRSIFEDIVWLVRCKDCKHWDGEYHGCNIRDSHGWNYKPDDYCSYGERKDK